uniref:Uncharacterized protein n=1 Tax=Rhizophora mucronata TaxID=61149 RepID=A0A2P2N319_RHIMU
MEPLGSYPLLPRRALCVYGQTSFIPIINTLLFRLPAPGQAAAH